MNKIASLGGMVVVLILSYGLDQVLELLRQENARTFETMLFLVRTVPLDLTFAGSILGLGWLFLFKIEKSPIMSLVFLVAGLLLLFSYPLLGLFATVPMGYLGPAFRFFFVTPTEFKFHAAAFLAAMGAVGIVRQVAGIRAQPRIQTASD